MKIIVDILRPLIELCYAVTGYDEEAMEELLGDKEILLFDKASNWADSVRASSCCRVCKADICQICLLVLMDMLFHIYLHVADTPLQ